MDMAALAPILAAAGQDEGALIGVLQQAQDIYGYLPPEVLEHISEYMNLPPAKVLGVVTFYAQFRTRPVGKHLLMLCQGTACHVNGSVIAEEALQKQLGVAEGDISADGLFTYSNVACLGCCSLAPAMMVDGTVCGDLTEEKIKNVLQDFRKEEEQ